jgi:hypothetical protein
MADPADIQLNLDNDQAGQVVQQNVAVGAQTMLAFKVEQSKVPDYWGQKAKDTKIDDLASTNNWNDTTAYSNVANALKGFARDWLLQRWKCSTWKEINLHGQISSQFQPQFATQSDDKLIIDGLSDLAMKLSESTGELLARITNTMVIIKESYAAYEKQDRGPPA